MILRLSALSAAAWLARAAWRSRSFLSAVGSPPLAMARLMTRGLGARIVGRHIDGIADDMCFQLMALAVEVDPAWPRRHRPAGRPTADDEPEPWASLVEKHGSLAATASCLDLALNDCRRKANLSCATARLRETIGGRHGGSHWRKAAILPKQLRKQSWASYGTPR